MRKIVKILLCTLAIGIIAVVGAGCSLKDTIKQLTCKHDYGAVATELTKAATCAEDGEELWTCLLCGKEKTETVAKLPHTFNGGVETKKATCTSAGEIVYTCTVCDTEKVEVVEKIAHKEVKVESKVPTCTEDGCTEFLYCADCNQFLSPATVIKALGHSVQTTSGKPATCTEAGFTSGESCAVCGAILKAQEKLPVKGHSVANVPGKEATCTESGLTNGAECTTCGTVYVTQEIIPAMGHSFETVGECFVCSVCGFSTVNFDSLPVVAYTSGTPIVGKCLRFLKSSADVSTIDEKNDILYDYNYYGACVCINGLPPISLTSMGLEVVETDDYFYVKFSLLEYGDVGDDYYLCITENSVLSDWVPDVSIVQGI